MSLKYAGELIAAFIDREGGSVKGEVTTGTVPEGLKPVYVHRQSRTLSQILTQLLIGSNNYIANQVFLEVRGTLGGPRQPGEIAQGRERHACRQRPRRSIHLVEGSGISRDNRFTAVASPSFYLFEPNAKLLRSGDGTLFKTGTFSGVRTLAGYADTAKHGRVRFVISLKSNDSSMRFRLLKTIQAGL